MPQEMQIIYAFQNFHILRKEGHYPETLNSAQCWTGHSIKVTYAREGNQTYGSLH